MISKDEVEEVVEFVKEHADTFRRHGVHQLVFGGKLSITFGPEFPALAVNLEDEGGGRRPATQPSGGWNAPAGYLHSRTPQRRRKRKQDE